MAELREVVITIKQDSVATPEKPNEQATGDNKIAEATKKSGGISAGMSVLVNQVYQHMRTQVETEAKYQVNKYFNMRDDYINQRNMNNALSVIGMAVSFGASVVAGAKLGASFGGVGAVVGAIAGATFSGVSTGLSIYRALDQQNISISQLNAQLSFARERTGFSLVSGSIGEGK